MIVRVLSCVLAAGLVAGANASAQSLGDIARQEQQKRGQPQGSAASTAKRVLTNDDLPASSPSHETQPAVGNNGGAPEAQSREGAKPAKPTLSAEEWKARIQQHKDAIAELQKRIDKIEPSIHYVQNNRNAYIKAPEYNRHQDEKQQIVDQLKAQLAEQQSELADLQEQAKQAGFGNSVYQ